MLSGEGELIFIFRRHTQRAVALISTFLFIGLLFMMAASMVALSRTRVFSGVSQHHQAQALYLAESGLTMAMVELENSLDWTGVENATIEGMPGTYSVKFGTSDKMSSVNNIGNPSSAPSYRSDAVIPSNTALIIVTANVAGQEYVLESLVEGQGSIGYMSDAILASGRIKAHGDFHIDGISALDDDTPVDGSIQSNSSDPANVISWDGVGSAHIKGNVGTKASTADAVELSGAVVDGGAPILNASHNIPYHDIDAKVDANNTHAAPTFVSGGTTSLAGSNSVSGDTTVNGDIVLEDGAELFVNGSLQVNGSIRGNGTVWVKGDTSFKGDSQVTAKSDAGVSLFTKGNLKLTGFDGTEFLRNMDAETQDLLSASNEAVRRLQDTVGSSGNSTPSSAEDDVWTLSAIIGYHDYDNNGVPNGELMSGEVHSNLMGQLEQKLHALPTGESKAFLENRLGTLRKLFTSADDLPGNPEESDIIDQFNATGQAAGLVDAVLDQNDTDVWPSVVNLINSISYDKPGTAYFQGAIYTQGFFYADNEVNVLGAIMVDGKGATPVSFNRKVFDPASMSLVAGPEVTLKPGDVYLGANTRVTYVEEFFTDDATDITGPQKLAKKQWMGR